MGDLNLLNVFFDTDNFLFKSDVKDFSFPSKEDCKPEEEPAEWFTEDTLNQMLPLLDEFFSNCDENIENAAVNEHSYDSRFPQRQSSDSLEKSVSTKELTINANFMDDISPVKNSFGSICELQKKNNSKHGTNFSPSDETFFDAMEYMREEVIEFEEISVSSNPQSDESVLLSDDSSDADECDYFTENEIMPDHASKEIKIGYSKRPSKSRENLIRFPSKKMKLSAKLENKNERKGRKEFTDINFSHPRLQLTAEETKVALKEGIELPTHYPLTKEQQCQLRLIRRKIRNKISAQHSRRRKQEYVDRLEQKLKHSSEEKVRLMDRIKNLENEKSTMASNIRKLQAALARCSGQMAQPTSCLLVLIMSLALIVAPSLKNSSLVDENVAEKDISMFDGQSSSLLNSGRSSSRNLLFSQNSSENRSDANEELKPITDLLEKIRFPNSNVLYEYLDLLRMKTNEKNSSYQKKNNFAAKKYENFEIDEDNLPTPSKTMKAQELLPSEFDDSKNETADIEVQEPITVNWHVG